MSNKQLKSAIRRLRNGVPIYTKGAVHPRGTFKVQFERGAYILR